MSLPLLASSAACNTMQLGLILNGLPSLRVLALTQLASDIEILNIASLHINISKKPWEIRSRRPAKPQLYTSLLLLADKLQKSIAESSIHKSRIKNRLVKKASKNTH
jgi:hypothetical protein